jgi:hypothetical protein
MNPKEGPHDPHYSGFNGHTKRQHRATSRKGGLARIRKITREDQREWARKGGEANRKRWNAIRATRRAVEDF